MTTTPEELLPCPFCGHTSDIEDGDTVYPISRDMDLWTLSCGNCSAETLGRTREEAIKAWNTRLNND